MYLLYLGCMVFNTIFFKDAWFYEENTFEEDLEDDFESEEDYDDETYSRKGSKKKKAASRKPKVVVGFLFQRSFLHCLYFQGKPKKKTPAVKTPSRLIRSIKKDENDTENKPYVCECK